jgi:hypothetical protein
MGDAPASGNVWPGDSSFAIGSDANESSSQGARTKAIGPGEQKNACRSNQAHFEGNAGPEESVQQPSPHRSLRGIIAAVGEWELRGW